MRYGLITRHHGRDPAARAADNLRVLVVAGVSVVHTATGYLTGIVDW